MHAAVVMPTLGRPSITTAIQSIYDSGLVDDGWILVRAHGAYAYDRCAEMLKPLLDRNVLLTHTTNPWDMDETKKSAECLRGSTAPKVFHFIDDDDVLIPQSFGGYCNKRNLIEGQIFLFRGIFELHGILWRDPVVRQSNVSTQLIGITPSDLWGTWSNRYEKDFDFIQSSISNGMQPVFVNQIVAIHNGATWDYRPKYADLVLSIAGRLPVAGPVSFS